MYRNRRHKVRGRVRREREHYVRRSHEDELRRGRHRVLELEDVPDRYRFIIFENIYFC